MAMRLTTINETVTALRRGQAAIFPTETVYGLGVSVNAAESPQLLYDLKERDQEKPISWLVADIDDLYRYGKFVPDFARVLARTFWPGPLTLIVKASDEVPPAFRSADDTIGLRMPNNETALQLIRLVGCPLATTSANRAGYKAPQSFDDIEDALIKNVGAAFADDSDDNKSGIASTVINCTEGHPVMVRQGAITINDIKALC